MPPVYLLESDQLPQPMVLASLPDPNAVAPANPLTHNAFASGETDGVSYKLNRNSRRNELTAILGGGAIAVGQGLDLSDGGGLTLSVSTGAHNNGGWVYQSSGKTLVLPDNVYDSGDLTVRLHIWISRTGDLSYRTDLTQPASPSTYLGSVRTDSGAIFDIDYSGRVELNAIPYRRTADAGEPNDTLPATWRGIVRTSGGLYWWDGSAYIPSMDAQTVLVSLSHTTAGALEDVITAGTGISLAVVDTGGGVYALQISFDPETATGIPVVFPDSPPSFTVPIQRGGEGLFHVNWTARGSFVSDGVSANHALYSVQPTLAPSSGLDPAVLGPLIIEDVGYVYANANSNSYAPEFSRNGGGTILRIRDFSPAPSHADQNGTIDVTVILRLVGIGWAPGAEPDDGECVVTELYSAGPHKLEFTQVITITPGEMTRYRCDFHARGFFADDYSVRIIPDQGGIACTVLDSNRTVQGDSTDPEEISAAFDFDLQSALDTVAGDYGDETEVELRFVLTGPGYREVNPAGAITLTPETYEYPAFATEAYADAGDAVLQAQIDALGANGGLLCAFAKDDLDTLSGTEPSDYNMFDGPDFGGDTAELRLGGGSIGALILKLTSAPGSGNSVTATVYKNGSATLATVTVSDSNAIGHVQFIPGIAYTNNDLLEVRWASVGLSPGINGRCRVLGV